MGGINAETRGSTGGVINAETMGSAGVSSTQRLWAQQGCHQRRDYGLNRGVDNGETRSPTKDNKDRRGTTMLWNGMKKKGNSIISIRNYAMQKGKENLQIRPSRLCDRPKEGTG